MKKLTDFADGDYGITLGTAGNDTINITSFAPNGSSISTGAGNDIITAISDTAYTQNIYGGDGRDFITTFGGLGAANDNEDFSGGVRPANDNNQSQTKVAI